MPDLLIELFSEEIPAGMQRRAREDLSALMTRGLSEAGLTHGAAEVHSTPRRLTLHFEGVLSASPTITEERKGPKVGAPEKAIEGFLRGAGVRREDLEVRPDKKGEVYFAQITRPGRPAAEIVAEVLEKTIRAFPWPKSMRWGAGSLRWVRPLRAILCLLDGEVVPLDVDGIESGAVTEGHRFMAPAPISVRGFAGYREALAKAYVILDAEERAAMILSEARRQAQSAGLELVEDAGLLEEVAGLVEWPIVLIGEIGEDFLGLPPEVLRTSMKEHQKFFSLRDPKTGRIERFITVANRETADGGATILAGNQKVLAARLADAKFFWENDLRVAVDENMQPWHDALAAVTFHAKLGTQAEQIARMAALARELAPLAGADPDAAEEAARIAKADLASEMVYEFPELQGVMGRYYALKAGLAEAVADAARDHYAPLGPSDAVPRAPLSITVSLADKLDLLTGFWSIDEKPTGSKDPFALRRACLGVIRIVEDHALMVPLARIFGENSWSADLMAFFHDRLKVYLRGRGVRHDVIDACLAMPRADDLALLIQRATALQTIMDGEDGTNLVQGFKRANNILTQAEEADGVEYSFGADLAFAEVEEERALFHALAGAEARIKPAMAEGDFLAAMGAMAALRGPIDAFFEAVKINAESAAVRRNRLNLLHSVRATIGQVADLARMEG